MRAAEDAAGEPGQRPLVGLPSEWLERERAVGHAVVADRGQPRLRDRELDPERALQGDHLRLRRPRREQPLRRGDRSAARGRAAAVPEGGHEQRDERDHR